MSKPRRKRAERAGGLSAGRQNNLNRAIGGEPPQDHTLRALGLDPEQTLGTGQRRTRGNNNLIDLWSRGTISREQMDALRDIAEANRHLSRGVGIKPTSYEPRSPGQPGNTPLHLVMLHRVLMDWVAECDAKKINWRIADCVASGMGQREAGRAAKIRDVKFKRSLRDALDCYIRVSGWLR